MAAPAVQPLEVEVQPVLAMQVERACGTEPDQIAAAVGSGFGEIAAFAAQHHVPITGPPRAIYAGYGPTEVRLTLAMPTVGLAPADAGGPVRVSELPGTKALRFTHHGPYARLMATYGGITAWMTQHGYMESDEDWAKYMPMWEEYPTDPDVTPPEELVTHIYLPLPG
jgi:effector-binding domain-containing protein